MRVCNNDYGKGALMEFSKPRCFQRLGHFVPLSFTAFGGKIQAARYGGGR